MHRIHRALVGAALAVLGAHPVDAQPRRDYRCVVERVTSTDLDPKGRLAYLKSFVGKEFTVERRTGIMAGALKNAYLTNPMIVDPGSKDNSFKAVTTLPLNPALGPGSNAYLLVVNEYVEGPKKPFVFVENDEVYFGNCIHY